MATRAAQRWVYAQQLDDKLRAALANEKSHPSYQEVEELIQAIRIACQDTIFLDFEYAVRKGVEKRLWDGHVLINSRYRKILEPYRKVPEKKQMVTERRGIQKHYVDFIKTSQYFYKGYIQRLASHFVGFRNLRRIANRLSLDVTMVGNRVQVSEEVAKMIEVSCYTSLLRLGDLSRYRNQVRSKDRSWGPAMGYYSLANDLCPDNGSAQNQMAVIALADNNHIDAIYHLLRAVTIKEPYPVAEENLDKKFEKVLSSAKTHRPDQDSVSTLIWWFVLLQAYFHAGKETTINAELEREVLSRLAMLLKEQSAAADILEKFVIISMAAEYLAGERIAEQVKRGEVPTEEAKNSYYFSLAFNIQMMLVLLQTISPELDQDLGGEELPTALDKNGSDKPRDKISAIARRILPALRQYSTWLAGSKVYVLELPVPAVQLHGKELWNGYAIVLTKLANLFNIADLATVDYFLEEDEDTVGFAPLRREHISIECDLFTDMEGNKKIHSTEPGVQRYHPNQEMQARIRDILLAAASMESKAEIPIILHAENGRHIFTADDSAMKAKMKIQRPSPPSPESRRPSPSWPSSSQLSLEKFIEPSYGIEQDENEDEDENGLASDSIDNDPLASQMVDSLLEPNETSYGLSSSANETSYGMHTATANELLGSRPSLFTLQNSPFAPQAHELQATSPNRSLYHHTSPISLSTPEDRVAAAALLDQITGPSPTNSGFGSWGRTCSRPVSGSAQLPVNQLLQESLTQQYQVPYSSAFTNSSSVYGNTPQIRNRLNGGTVWGNVAVNGNSTVYAGASDFERTTMLNSSIWNGNPGLGEYVSTPPGGQGG